MSTVLSPWSPTKRLGDISKVREQDYGKVVVETGANGED